METDDPKFSFNYIVSLSPAWATGEPVSKQKTKEIKENIGTSHTLNNDGHNTYTSAGEEA